MLDTKDLKTNQNALQQQQYDNDTNHKIRRTKAMY
jgi:hypothetical protein